LKSRSETRDTTKAPALQQQLPADGLRPAADAGLRRHATMTIDALTKRKMIIGNDGLTTKSARSLRWSRPDSADLNFRCRRRDPMECSYLLIPRRSGDGHRWRGLRSPASAAGPAPSAGSCCWSAGAWCWSRVSTVIPFVGLLRTTVRRRRSGITFPCCFQPPRFDSARRDCSTARGLFENVLPPPRSGPALRMTQQGIEDHAFGFAQGTLPACQKVSMTASALRLYSLPLRIYRIVGRQNDVVEVDCMKYLIVKAVEIIAARFSSGRLAGRSLCA